MKKVTTIIKLVLPAGKATPAPPVGPALGPHGVSSMMFCKEYNAKTADKVGLLIPAEISVYDDKTFTFVLKTPPASALILKAIGLEKGSGEPNRKKVASITREQLIDIAKIKFPDLNTQDIQTATKIIEGTARNMGVNIIN
uniref:Large ribosomal subunit protein uL11m n=1 Tax=Cyanoptyche gloeocystis TaxID=77922 RepID=A0A3G1IWL5_9EUKA|nr:ribosomal protein L11 [Cyanoptyche gloeocystis]